MYAKIKSNNGYTEKVYVKYISDLEAIVFSSKKIQRYKFLFCKKNKKYISIYNGKILYLDFSSDSF